MTNSKDFPLGDILTLTTGETVEAAFMLADGGMVALRELISYMTGEEMLTDTAVQLLAPECREGLLVQHPELMEAVEPPVGANPVTWDETLKKKFGDCLSVKPL